MKTYKHKTLGWIAKKRIDYDYRIYVGENGIEMDVMDFVKKELIENSSDREEVVEKDWISNAWKEYEECWTTNGYEEFREIIGKHVPKVKKFTRDDVTNRKHAQDKFELQNMTLSDMICSFLTDHGIYDDRGIYE